MSDTSPHSLAPGLPLLSQSAVVMAFPAAHSRVELPLCLLVRDASTDPGTDTPPWRRDADPRARRVGAAAA